MRKDWDRGVFRASGSNRSVTEGMYGGIYIESPFAKISKEEEVTYFAENIRVKHRKTLIDDYSIYLQDGEFSKEEVINTLTNIICHEYDREFYAWMERGFRLWGLYPSATENSKIVQIWAQEIELIRREFRERSKVEIPF